MKTSFTKVRAECLCGRPLYNGPQGVYCELFVIRLTGAQA